MTDTSPRTTDDNQRFGFVAVIGEPNAGKSTLINHLVGSKISIVSPKVQTTRTRVLGIALCDQSQIVFVDTPGIFKPSSKNTLERAIVSSAIEGIQDADLITLLVDVSKKKAGISPLILDQLKTYKNKAVILVLNKVDKIKREKLMDITQQLNEIYDFEQTFMISALKGSGTKDLLSYLAKHAPKGPWHYPEDQITDMPMRLMAAEITREKIFKLLHQEIPYGITVETDEWEEFGDGSIKISQTIFTSRDAHKKIILGKGGAMIKKVGEMARGEMENILEKRAHLKLFVKLQENWQSDQERYALWGLDKNAKDF
ncbi:MAG: GTPase Era [Alphaproteobacteria bacterium]|nr:GTPase Era [Alphaproteobacteria bacterium]